MTDKITSIYNFFNAVIAFVSTLTGWFGFTAIGVLIGVFFFYKIFSIFFPVDRWLNMVFSFAAFAALWFTWNMNYYKEPGISRVLYVYAFIAAHGAIFYAIHFTLGFLGKRLYRRIFRKKISKEDTLSAYEAIDKSAQMMKEALRQGDFRQINQTLDELSQQIKSIDR